MATHAYCIGCRKFFDHKLPSCPECEQERSRVNAHLHGASLNRALYKTADSAHAEKKWEQARKQGHSPPVPKRTQRIAKQLVKDM